MGGNSSGFLTAWVDTSGIAYSSFSSNNGASWSSPIQIATNLHAHSDVSLSGGIAGFVAAWVGNDSNAYASFSSDHGNTWSAPVMITNDGSVKPFFEGFAFNLYNFIGVSTVGNGCMFTWLDSSDNAFSSFSTIFVALEAPTNLTGSQNTNDFGISYELFNTLQWGQSPSTNVFGYFIYRDGVKIASVNPYTFTYQDHNRKKKVTTNYSVTAYDVFGNESPAATININ